MLDIFKSKYANFLVANAAYGSLILVLFGIDIQSHNILYAILMMEFWPIVLMWNYYIICVIAIVFGLIKYFGWDDITPKTKC